MTRSTRRIAFELQVDPTLIDEYVRRHAAVWPRMLAEIEAAGRRNYSLFLAEGGRLFGYYETDDDEAAQRYLAKSVVAAEWEAEMADFFVGLIGRPDQVMNRLPEIFNLDTQLHSARISSQEFDYPEGSTP